MAAAHARMAAANALDAEALVRGVRRCAGTLPPDEAGAMLAAALSAVNENDAASRGLAKVLRSEAKRHNSAKAAAAFATAGGAAAAVALVHSYFHDPPLERIQAATDSVAALADLAAAGGAAQTAVIEAGAAARVWSMLWNLRNEQNKCSPLSIQVCRLAGNMCFGGVNALGDNFDYIVGHLDKVVICAEDATTFRWAAHAIWNACTHSEVARDELHRRTREPRVVEAFEPMAARISVWLSRICWRGEAAGCRRERRAIGRWRDLGRDVTSGVRSGEVGVPSGSGVRSKGTTVN